MLQPPTFSFFIVLIGKEDRTPESVLIASAAASRAAAGRAAAISGGAAIEGSSAIPAGIVAAAVVEIRAAAAVVSESIRRTVVASITVNSPIARSGRRRPAVIFHPAGRAVVAAVIVKSSFIAWSGRSRPAIILHASGLTTIVLRRFNSARCALGIASFHFISVIAFLTGRSSHFRQCTPFGFARLCTTIGVFSGLRHNAGALVVQLTMKSLSILAVHAVAVGAIHAVRWVFTDKTAPVR